MRRIVITGLIVSSALTFSWVGGASGQRVREGAAATTRPTQVQVTNFPAVQGVTGTVNVGNLPAVQNVSGTVAVGNLPLDTNGRVLVATQPIGSAALVVHSTTATYTGDLGGRTGATQKCQAEFPGSHFVHSAEVASAQSTGRAIIWLSDETRSSWLDDLNANQSTCLQWRATMDSGNRTFGIVIGATGGSSLFPLPPYANGADCAEARPMLCAD